MRCLRVDLQEGDHRVGIHTDVTGHVQGKQSLGIGHADGGWSHLYDGLNRFRRDGDRLQQGMQRRD
jgi:hypothetical protein